MGHGAGSNRWWIGGLGALAVLMCAMAPAPAEREGSGRLRCGPADCRSCHHIEPDLSHPIDVVPSMWTPPHLVLENGTMTCVTCHGHRSGDAAGGPVTDPARDPGLCAACHDPVRGDARQIHAASLGRAHLLAPGTSGAQRLRGPSWPGEFDAESQACLECHDGTLARIPGIRTGPRGPASAARLLGGRHPIGVEQRPRGAGDNLVPAHTLDPRIRLFDGRVGCGSCHNPYSGHEAMLVMSNQASALCLTCHDF